MFAFETTLNRTLWLGFRSDFFDFLLGGSVFLRVGYFAAFQLYRLPHLLGAALNITEPTSNGMGRELRSELFGFEGAGDLAS
jgi:hypothetical protein